MSKSKMYFNMKSSTYYFHMKTKISAEFQICISVHLKFIVRFLKLVSTHKIYISQVIKIQAFKTSKSINNLKNLLHTIFRVHIENLT